MNQLYAKCPHCPADPYKETCRECRGAGFLPTAVYVGGEVLEVRPGADPLSAPVPPRPFDGTTPRVSDTISHKGKGDHG